MDDNCGECVECIGVASRCGEQEVGVASGSGWNLWLWVLGVVVRRYIDFLILLIPTPLECILFCSSIYIRWHVKRFRTFGIYVLDIFLMPDSLYITNNFYMCPTQPICCPKIITFHT